MIWGTVWMKPAATLEAPEIGQGLGATLKANYRGSRWLEATAALNPDFALALETRRTEVPGRAPEHDDLLPD
jgi:hypothetical protein